MAVHAAVFSDDFSVSQTTSTNNASAGFDTGSTLMTSYGSRLIQTDILANTAPGDARGRTAITGGAFSFSSDDGVTGLGYLTYSFNNAINLTPDPVFVFTFLSNDDSGQLTINVVDRTGATATTNYVLPEFPAAAAPLILTVPVSYTGINSAAVSKLVFSFGGTSGEDLSLDSIQAVPEPGTLDLVAVLGGILGVGLLVRLRRA